jgi:hypothetical protein
VVGHRLVGSLVLSVVLALVAGCSGDDDGPGEVVAGGAPADESPGAAAVTAATPVDVTARVAVDDAAPTTAADPVLTSATATPLADPIAAEVSVDDPVPAQGNAEVDPAVAEAAVRYAFTHWILIDLDPDLRARLVEGGESRRDELQDGFVANRPIVEFARFVVDEVRFTSATEAEVVFRIRWHDGPSPYFPDAITGTSVFADGTWRVATATTCLLAIGAGQPCGGPADPADADAADPGVSATRTAG